MANIDIEQVFNTLESLQYVRLSKRRNQWLSLYCPFHNDGNERRPSFGVLLQSEYRNGTEYPSGFCHCFTCSYAKPLEDFISDVLEKQGISMTGVEWLSKNVEGYEESEDFDYLLSGDLMSSLNNQFAINYIQSRTSTDTIEYVSEEELQAYRYVVPYMYERKLTDEIIEKYDVGYDANWVPPGRVRKVPCITFPVRDVEGNTLFLCRRSIEGKLYNYPTGASKPVYGIYELPKDTTSVVICESCINALTAVSYGYPAVALLGTGNAFQMKQLQSLGVNEFIIATDGDDAGRRAAKKLKNNLKSVAIVWVIEMPEGKDLNDLTKEEFDELYRVRV